MKALAGFGSQLLYYDRKEHEELRPIARLVDARTLARESDIVVLNLPLTRETHHFVNEEMMLRLKLGVLIINTGRGPLIDTKCPG